MGDFNALTYSREQHGMIADDIAAAHGGKTDSGRIALTRHTFPTIHGALSKIAPQRVCDYFAQTQRRTGRCIHFMPVVRLDYFDIVALRQNARGGFQQLENQIHANAHVRGKHDTHILRRRTQLRLLLCAKTRGADYHVHTQPAADFQVAERAFRASEINQHIRALQCSFHIGADFHAAYSAGQLSGIPPQHRTAVMLQRGMQHQVVGLCDTFQQHPAHAAAAAGDGDFNFAHFLIPYRCIPLYLASVMIGSACKCRSLSSMRASMSPSKYSVRRC